MYAVVEWGGKQYKIEEGSILDVEKIDGEEGSLVVFDKVLLYSDGDKIHVGNPYIEGMQVKATLEEQRKGKKVIVFKYRRRHKYRVKNGHRQRLSRVKINKISK